MHKFAPFVTIKRRAQIGMTFGGGVAWPKGVAERHAFREDLIFSPPNGFVPISTETVSLVEATELFILGAGVVPIFKLELTGAVIVAPGLKVKAGGGINFTNSPEFSLSVVYLFGSKR